MNRKPRPQNPLGIVALFVTLVEAMATVSLKLALDSESAYAGHIVWFIMLFPVLLLLLFFGTLWVKRESVYSPGDFRDDQSFLRLFQRLETLELRQRAAQIDPRSATKEDALAVVRELLRAHEYSNAAHLASGFLKVGHEDIAAALLHKLKSSVTPEEYSETTSYLKREYPDFFASLNQSSEGGTDRGKE